MTVFLTFGDVLLTPAKKPEASFLLTGGKLTVGLLSYHGWENRCHKLLFTSKRLSRIFYNEDPLALVGRVNRFCET